MSLKKQMSFNKGIYRCCTEKDKWKRSAAEQGKSLTDEPQTPTAFFFSQHSHCAEPLDRPHLAQVHPLIHASFSYSIHFKIHHGHEYYEKQYSVSCDDSTGLSDFDPNLSIKIFFHQYLISHAGQNQSSISALFFQY